MVDATALNGSPVTAKEREQAALYYLLRFAEVAHALLLAKPRHTTLPQTAPPSIVCIQTSSASATVSPSTCPLCCHSLIALLHSTVQAHLEVYGEPPAPPPPITTLKVRSSPMSLCVIDRMPC